MSWTTPKTWQTEPLTSVDLNIHLRDNLLALKYPPTAHVEVSLTSNIVSGSTSFVPVDPANFNLTLATSGGDVLVGFCGSVGCDAAQGMVNLNLELDGGPVALDDGILLVQTNSASVYAQSTSFTYLLTDVPAGSHTIRLLWKVQSGNAYLYTSTTVGSGFGLHPQFWARELS